LKATRQTRHTAGIFDAEGTVDDVEELLECDITIGFEEEFGTREGREALRDNGELDGEADEGGKEALSDGRVTTECRRPCWTKASM